MSKAKKRTVEDRLVGGLKKFVTALKSGQPITEKFTCRTVVVDLKPKRYTGNDVKATRELLNASQGVFAQFLGVSVKTLRAWEQGVNRPNGMACRFLDEIARNPDYMRGRLRQSLQVRDATFAK
jgi:putative transcriptional regulator